VSQRLRQSIPVWVKWKYAADLELSKRTAFKWFILRPGGLLDEPGAGKADIGITHISQQIAVSNHVSCNFTTSLLHRKPVYAKSAQHISPL